MAWEAVVIGLLAGAVAGLAFGRFGRGGDHRFRSSRGGGGRSRKGRQSERQNGQHTHAILLVMDRRGRVANAPQGVLRAIWPAARIHVTRPPSRMKP